MAQLRKTRKSYGRYAGALLSAAALIGVAATSGSQAAEGESEIGFDFDTENAAIEVIFPHTEGPMRELVSANGADATTILRVAAVLEAAWFDAIAPYHPTAVGIASDLGRRPASESETNRNMNIAMMHATYTVLTDLLPKGEPKWRNMMTSIGLDPDDDQQNTETAVGIGNMAGTSMMEIRLHDGMNQLGDEGGVDYNRQPFADYTGYQPVNTATRIKDPSRWQPALTTTGNGIFQSQQFATPQMALTTPFTYDDPAEFLSPRPVNSDYQHNRRGYKRQTDEVLAASAALNDVSKMKVEFFADKYLSLGYGTLDGLDGENLPLEEMVHRFTASNIGGFDALIAVWNSKVHWDAPRPYTTIRTLYGDEEITAWGGPGQGTVNDITGDEWAPYASLTDHGEYPSGSTSLCAVLGQVGRSFSGTDETQIDFPFAQGSSTIEPGITPAADLNLHWDSWTEYVDDCAQSRIDGGAHFQAAVQESIRVGTLIGDRAYAFIQDHINGTAEPMN